MRFDERWTSDEQLTAITDLVAKTSELPGEVIEIGTWQGLSAIPIANAIHPDTLHVVDHWLGDEGISGIDPEVVKRDNYGIFLNNIKEGTAGNVWVHKMGWREFAKDWELPIRFLYIDAAHTRKEVSDNIAVLLPFAVPGAIIAGDDWQHPPVREGVGEHFHKVWVQLHKLWWVQI